MPHRSSWVNSLGFQTFVSELRKKITSSFDVKNEIKDAEMS
jgi:hypothetical protein